MRGREKEHYLLRAERAPCWEQVQSNVWSFGCTNNDHMFNMGRSHVHSVWASNPAERPLVDVAPSPRRDLTLCAVTANCSALFIMSAVLSSARPSRSPRSFRAWLAFCTALVTLSAAEWRMLLPADGGERERRMWIIITSLEFFQVNGDGAKP